MSLRNYSLDARREVIKLASNKEAYETIKDIDKRHQNIVKEAVQVSQFFINIPKDDFMMTVFIRNGTISFPKFEKFLTRDRFYGSLDWIISFDRRIFAGINKIHYQTKFLPTAVYEVDAELGKRYDFYSFKEQVIRNNDSLSSKACVIRDMIIIVGEGNSNKVEILRINDNPSKIVCATKLLWNNRSKYSLTSLPNNRIILAGGLSREVQNFQEYHSSVHEGIVNEEENDVIWQDLPPMSERRWCHAAFYLDDSFYVAGGLGGWRNDCEVYSTTSNKWSKAPNMPKTLIFPHALTDSSKEYALILGILHTAKFQHTGVAGKLHVISFENKTGFNDLGSTSIQMTYDKVLVII